MRRPSALLASLPHGVMTIKESARRVIARLSVCADDRAAGRQPVTDSSDSRGNAPDGPEVVEAIRIGAPLLGGRPIVVMTVTRHVYDRVFPTPSNHAIIDLSDLRKGATSATARLQACKAAARRVQEVLDNLDSPVLVHDGAEGWLHSFLSIYIRKNYRNATTVGLQHGLMPINSPIASRIMVRRLRVLMVWLQSRVLGGVVVGAGFGNVQFDRFITMGREYSNYIRRLQPTALVDDDAKLLMPRRESTGGAAELVFLDQDLRAYLQDDIPLVKAVLCRLAELEAARGTKLVFQVHPDRDVDLLDLESIVEIKRGEGTWSYAGPNTVFVSYFSTGLLEASAHGHNFVALRVDGIPKRLYRAFRGSLPLAEFLDHWNFDEFSELADGVVSG